MIILALDTGIKTGWCTEHHSGVQVFDTKRGESLGMRFLRFRAWLKELSSLMGKIDVIVYEQAHHRGGFATETALGFITEVKTFAAECNAELMPVHTGTLKKWATGSGKGDKSEMIVKAKSYIAREPIDDNEADAVLIYQWAKQELKI